MQLRKQGAIFDGHGSDALAESGDGFSNVAYALLVVRGKKKGAQEWAMETIAEGELGLAQTREELIHEIGRIPEQGQERFAPELGGFRSD